MQSPTLIPAPWSRSDTGGTLTLGPDTSLAAAPALRNARTWFGRALGAATGWDLPPSEQATVTFAVDLELPAEGYRLLIAQNVVIEAADDAGAQYGAQTLLALLGPAAYRSAPLPGAVWELPTLAISDHPRFAYRGVMLDVARHFMPKHNVLRFLDVAASHKLNVVHLHLSDDQGWRIHINAYPKLTEVGAWRRESGRGSWRAGEFDGAPHGGFYSQDDLREMVAFAAGRNITLIPEIDVPGHSQAAIAAYPELGLPDKPLEVWTSTGINPNVLETTPFAVEFYTKVLDEVMDIFPSTWIGLGGDEVPLEQWEASPVARAQAAGLGLTTVGGLHGWFIAQLAQHLHQHGRKTAVWDEVGDYGLPEGALVHSWRGFEGGLAALAGGYDVVMCPEHKLYLDHRQAAGADEPVPVGFLTTLADVYAFEPLPAGAATDFPGRLLGAQANIWTEHLPDARRVDYTAYPRLSAAAEVFWSDPASRDFPDFLRRLTDGHLDRLTAQGVEFRPLDGPHPWQQRPGITGWQRDHEQEQRAAAGTL